MSAGKNRQTCPSYPTEQSPRLRRNAVVISAVAGADVRCAPHPSLDLHSWLGAVLGCQAMSGTGGGAETLGVSTR